VGRGTEFRTFRNGCEKRPASYRNPKGWRGRVKEKKQTWALLSMRKGLLQTRDTWGNASGSTQEGGNRGAPKFKDAVGFSKKGRKSQYTLALGGAVRGTDRLREGKSEMGCQQCTIKGPQLREIGQGGGKLEGAATGAEPKSTPCSVHVKLLGDRGGIQLRAKLEKDCEEFGPPDK